MNEQEKLSGVHEQILFVTRNENDSNLWEGKYIFQERYLDEDNFYKQSIYDCEMKMQDNIELNNEDMDGKEFFQAFQSES